MKIYVLPIFAVLICGQIHTQPIKQFADSIRNANQIPELGYAIIKTSKIIEVEVMGYRRADSTNNNSKASITDYFHIGSNTKAITSFVAAYLVKNKKISWDTKFFDLFPSLRARSDRRYSGITLSDLLSHRAHIEPYTSGLEFQELPKFEGSRTEQRKLFAKYLLKEKPVPIGSSIYHYSNAGYSLAALMLEKRCGKSWEELVKSIFSHILHLKVAFGWPNNISINEPWGHWIENDTLKALPPHIDYDLKLIEPAGDISMPLPDYAKFIQLNLQGLSGSDNILSANTYDFLHYGAKNYAMGWANLIKKGDQISSHAGSAGTFYCLTIINKTKQIAFVVIANSATDKCQQALHKLSEKMSEMYAN